MNSLSLQNVLLPATLSTAAFLTGGEASAQTQNSSRTTTGESAQACRTDPIFDSIFGPCPSQSRRTASGFGLLGYGGYLPPIFVGVQNSIYLNPA